MEEALRGYCRTIDGARMVLVETEDGALDYDWDYDVCLWRDRCEIGKRITAFKEETK